MNIDLRTLTTAVHNAANTTTPRKSRRRGSNSIDAQKFLEAAHKSWTFGLEDLPAEESTALQKRRSSRGLSDLQFKETAHKSWAALEYGDVANDKGNSRRSLPPLNKKAARRASLSGVMINPSLREESVDDPVNTGKKLSRRSSLQYVSRKKLSEDKANDSFRTASSDPTPMPSKKRHGKIARRSTIGSTTPEDGSPIEHGTRTKSRRSSQKSSLPVKGTVRFEMDHKNRIKRRVCYFRSQASRSRNTSALWWSEEDLERIYERENRVYEKFSADRKYKKSIQQIWGSCSKAAKVPLSSKAITHVAGAPCRGLEVDILETVRDRRARVIHSVLDAQDTLLDFDPNIRSKVLGARYKNLCRSAERFARKMAEGDALEAANVYSN